MLRRRDHKPAQSRIKLNLPLQDTFCLQSNVPEDENIHIQLGKENLPQLFQAYPEAKQLATTWACANLQKLSTENFLQYIVTGLLPGLYCKHKAECAASNTNRLTEENFNLYLNLRNP